MLCVGAEYDEDQDDFPQAEYTDGPQLYGIIDSAWCHARDTDSGTYTIYIYI